MPTDSRGEARFTVAPGQQLTVHDGSVGEVCRGKRDLGKRLGDELAAPTPDMGRSLPPDDLRPDTVGRAVLVSTGVSCLIVSNACKPIRSISLFGIRISWDRPVGEVAHAASSTTLTIKEAGNLNMVYLCGTARCIPPGRPTEICDR